VGLRAKKWALCPKLGQVLWEFGSCWKLKGCWLVVDIGLMLKEN
jgi:hypothetical protein